MLKKKSASYSVTANANTSDNSAKNDAGEVKVENNVVTATPKVGYEVTAVTVKKKKKIGNRMEKPTIIGGQIIKMKTVYLNLKVLRM